METEKERDSNSKTVITKVLAHQLQRIIFPTGMVFSPKKIALTNIKEIGSWVIQMDKEKLSTQEDRSMMDLINRD